MDISVIIPTYNHAHFLATALASVQAQTYTGWEAIVVDDGSQDDPAAVVDAAGDARIRLIRQENRGLSAARNSGLAASRAPLLAFLDADDAWEPEFLATCRAHLAGEPAAAGVYTRAAYMDAAGQLLPGAAGETVPGNRFRRRLLEGGFFPVHAALVRRAAVDRAGHFDEALTSLEDWDLWLRLSRRDYLTGINAPLAVYRLSPGSMSTDHDRMHRNRLHVLAKQFGPFDSPPDEWPEEKRRGYAFALRQAAYDAWESGRRDAAGRHLAAAIAHWPAIAARPDTYYELASRAVPRGQRGVMALDLGLAETELFAEVRRLDLPPEAGRAAKGALYHALALLADSAGDLPRARRFLRQAISADSGLIADRRVARRLLKLHLPRPVARKLGARRAAGEGKGRR